MPRHFTESCEDIPFILQDFSTMTDRTYEEIEADIKASSNKIWHLSEQLTIMLKRDVIAEQGDIERCGMALEAEEDHLETLQLELEIVCARMAA